MFNNTVPTTFHLSSEAEKFKAIIISRSQHYINNPGVIPNEGDYHFEVKLLVGLSITTLLVKDHSQVALTLPALEKFILSIDSFENSHQTDDLFNYASSVAVIVSTTIQRMGYAAKYFPHYCLLSKTLRSICENVAIITSGKEKESKELLKNWLQ